MSGKQIAIEAAWLAIWTIAGFVAVVHDVRQLRSRQIPSQEIRGEMSSSVRSRSWQTLSFPWIGLLLAVAVVGSDPVGRLGGSPTLSDIGLSVAAFSICLWALIQLWRAGS